VGVVGKQSGWSLLLQALGAAGWGVFFSIAPIVEVLFLTAILWIPLLLYLEFRRARRHGFLPGFLIRLATAAAVVTAAFLAPVKWEDQHGIEGLPGQRVTFVELSRHMRLTYPPSHTDRPITLASRFPTFREVIRAIESQTGLKCRVWRCANSMSILRGGYVMSVSAGEPLATAR
jgi:hypothetical protein